VRPAGRRAVRLSGFAIILIATAIAGIASYAVTILVPNRIGLAGYAIFAVFWSFIYLIVGALGGIQQEVTRATMRRTDESTAHASRARSFGIVAGVIVFAVIVGTAPIWVNTTFPEDGWALVWPLAIGASSYVMVAVLAGSLYGVAAWIPLALMISVDAILRLVALAITLWFTTEIVALAWSVAIPFPLALVVLWPFIRRSIVGRSELDVGYRALSWNVARTIVAAAATAVMVSGFPLLLGLTSHSEPKAILGMYIVTITLTRAPLIVVALSLQSYLVVQFRDNTHHVWRRLAGLLGVVFAGGAALAVAGWFLGPPVYHFLFPNKLQPDAPFFAILVGSSALVAALCITAPAVLARGKHVVYTGGWVAAAIVTIAALMLPIDFASRTIWALVGGPVVGLLVHGSYLVSLRLRAPRAPTV
jgi:O-antigen/teichoic acid export membrane protein